MQEIDTTVPVICFLLLVMIFLVTATIRSFRKTRKKAGYKEIKTGPHFGRSK